MARAIFPGKQDDEQVSVHTAREEDELPGEKGRVVNRIWPKLPNSASQSLERDAPIFGLVP